MQGAQVQSLVGDLRSPVLHGVAKKNKTCYTSFKTAYKQGELFWSFFDKNKNISSIGNYKMFIKKDVQAPLTASSERNINSSRKKMEQRNEKEEKREE